MRELRRRLAGSSGPLLSLYTLDGLFLSYLQGLGRIMGPSRSSFMSLVCSPWWEISALMGTGTEGVGREHHHSCTRTQVNVVSPDSGTPWLWLDLSQESWARWGRQWLWVKEEGAGRFQQAGRDSWRSRAIEGERLLFEFYLHVINNQDDPIFLGTRRVACPNPC